MKMAKTTPNFSEAEQLLKRNHQLSILNSIAQALNRSLDLDEAMNNALAQVAELLELRTGWVWLLKEADNQPYLAAAQNLPPGLVKRPKLMEGSCYCLDTYQAGDLEGAANVNVVTCSRLKKLVDDNNGLRYHASIPLYAHGRKLGVMNVASTDWRELSAEDLRLLYTIGDLLSIAIERARLFTRSAESGAVEERNRLAREIHDTLAQGLAGITLQLETADALLESGQATPKVRKTIGQALKLARNSLEEARRSVLDLRAAPLEGRTLAQALKVLAQETAAKGDLEVEFELVGGERPLPVRIEAGLYRMAQEALANVVQHAAAQRVGLGLTTLPDQVTLVVADDGHGFDPERTQRDRFGLIGLNERAKLLGGTLQLHSSPEAGTRIEINVPVRP
jgi:two-component system NarL family sensor kinase